MRHSDTYSTQISCSAKRMKSASLKAKALCTPHSVHSLHSSSPALRCRRYAAAWSSDWRTNDPKSSGKGGDWDESAAAQGKWSRYGPIKSFPYRFMMSSLRSIQMRVTYLLASTVVVNPSLYAYVALELDRTPEDAPDAWCVSKAAHACIASRMHRKVKCNALHSVH